MTVLLIVAVQVVVFAYLLRKVWQYGLEIRTAGEYLTARSASYHGLSPTVAWLTAVATNFQTASVLFVGVVFGYRYGMIMSLTALSFAAGVIVLLWASSRLSSAEKDLLFSNSRPVYLRLFSSSGKTLMVQARNWLIYGSVLASAVLELYFGSTMVDKYVSIIPPRHSHFHWTRQCLLYFVR